MVRARAEPQARQPRLPRSGHGKRPAPKRRGRDGRTSLAPGQPRVSFTGQPKGKKAVPSESLRDKEIPSAPDAQVAPTFHTQREAGGGRRPFFQPCIWGRGQGRATKPGAPYLLLEPGAMAPSPPDPETNAGLPTPPGALRAGIPLAQDGREFEFGALFRH